MALQNFLFSSEAVSEGHPDKVCDQISDAVLDAALAGDRDSRVACETLVKNNLVVLAGEITTRAKFDYIETVRAVVRDIGYTDEPEGFAADTCAIMTVVNRQSPDIAQGVDESTGKDQGAGDQGMMFGYACDETKEYMPFPIFMAQRLVQELAQQRKAGALPFLRPDAKSQVTVEYRDGRPARASTVVVSSQHSRDVPYETLREAIVEEVVKRVIPPEFLDQRTAFLINPTGRFEVGGPVADAGLTGRKIIVDTYGGYGRHGGGAFSGKDPSKVDRSAAYMARYIAKNIVAAGLTTRCEVQLAYAIGVAEPVSVLVDSFGTGTVSDPELARIVRDHFDMRPAGIIRTLDLKRPIYRPTSCYGHFGREPKDGLFTWERTDLASKLR